MKIEVLCEAVKESLAILSKSRSKVTDHSLVEEFQKNIADILNQISPDYSWEIEHKPSRRSEGDSIDIFGYSRKLPSWIIEIDAYRADQVAKKLLSRVALWGLKDSIEYVAILYPNTQNGKKECEKFLRYGDNILHKLNSKSNITGIFVEPANNTIEVLSFRESCHFDVNGKEYASMTNAVAGSIKEYLEKHENISFAELKNVWGKFVSDCRGASRYKDIKQTSSDGYPIYTFTQFRQYGLCSYWDDFVKLCKAEGIIVTQKRKYYIGEEQATPYQYF